MNLHKLITEKLESKNENEIVKQLGYNSKMKGLKILHKFLDAQDINTWLQVDILI